MFNAIIEHTFIFPCAHVKEFLQGVYTKVELLSQIALQIGFLHFLEKSYLYMRYFWA